MPIEGVQQIQKEPVFPREKNLGLALRGAPFTSGNARGFATESRGKCGMLQAKAMHLFFSEAMTEGTAGNGSSKPSLRGGNTNEEL
jgi:hypothetical protein